MFSLRWEPSSQGAECRHVKAGAKGAPLGSHIDSRTAWPDGRLKSTEFELLRMTDYLTGRLTDCLTGMTADKST